MPQDHVEASALMREVLGDGYTNLQVRRLVIEEDIENQTTSVSCEVTQDGSAGDPSVIAGKGVGVIDAFFHGVQSRFAEEYPSLKTIRFSSFSVEAQLDTKQEFAGTDSLAKITIEIANDEDKRFTFSHTSRSVIGGGIVTTLRGLEYFINSERAFVTTYHALKDAQGRSRSDLVQRYTNNLSVLVKNTSYSEVIARLKSDI